MKPISYVEISENRAVRDFVLGRVVCLYVDGEFYEGMERVMRPNTMRRKRYYSRMMRAHIRELKKEGIVTFKSRPRIP